MSAKIVKVSGAAFCLAPPIGGFLVSNNIENDRYTQQATGLLRLGIATSFVAFMPNYDSVWPHPVATSIARLLSETLTTVEECLCCHLQGMIRVSPKSLD